MINSGGEIDGRSWFETDVSNRKAPATALNAHSRIRVKTSHDVRRDRARQDRM